MRVVARHSSARNRMSNLALLRNASGGADGGKSRRVLEMIGPASTRTVVLVSRRDDT